MKNTMLSIRTLIFDSHRWIESGKIESVFCLFFSILLISFKVFSTRYSLQLNTYDQLKQWHSHWAICELVFVLCVFIGIDVVVVIVYMVLVVFVCLLDSQTRCQMCWIQPIQHVSAPNVKWRSREHLSLRLGRKEHTSRLVRTHN